MSTRTLDARWRTRLPKPSRSPANATGVLGTLPATRPERHRRTAPRRRRSRDARPAAETRSRKAPRRAARRAPPLRARRRAERAAAEAARRTEGHRARHHRHPRHRRARADRLHARRPGPQARRSSRFRGRSVQVADHPVRQGGETGRRVLDRERAVREQTEQAFRPLRRRARRERRADLRGAPDDRRRPSSRPPRRSAAGLGRLPADQARGVTGRVDDHRPLVAERVGDADRDLGRLVVGADRAARRRPRTRRPRRRRARAAGSGARPRGSCARTGRRRSPPARRRARSPPPRSPATARPASACCSCCGRTGESPAASAAKIDGRSVGPSSDRARSSAAGTDSPLSR